MKKYWPYFIYLTLFVVLCHYNLITIEDVISKNDSGFYFDIITVSSIIAGFMFTSLSILVSISSTKTIRVLERSKHMDLIYFNISLGLGVSVVVIALSLMILFIELPVSISNHIVLNFICKNINKIMLAGIGMSILSFGLSVLDLRFLILEIRKGYKLSISSSEIQKVLSEIKK